MTRRGDAFRWRRGLLLLCGLPTLCAVDDGCAYPKVTDAVRWWSEALAGRSTRAECEQQADQLLLAIENGCLPMHEPVLWQVATGLTYQILRDVERTLRALELQIAAIGASDNDQLGLLRERAESLRPYAQQAAASDSETAAARDAENDCGRLSLLPAPVPAAAADGASGGWLITKSSARSRWGGGGHCTIREIKNEDWSTASAACRKVLARAPFVVRGGGDDLLNRSQFRRDAMLATMSQSHVAVGRPGHNAPLQMTFAEYLEEMRRETDTEMVDTASSYAFESQLLERHHRTLLRGLRLTHLHLGDMLNLKSPLLANIAMGSAGSGVYFHRHDAAISALFFGEKRWFFHPDLPGSPAMREEHVHASSSFLLPGASNSALLANQTSENLDKRKVLSCVQRPGDLIYIPHMWYHATTSLSETVGIALRESTLGPMVTDATGRSRYLPLDVATRRWLAQTQEPKGSQYVPLTHGETGQPRPMSEGRLSFDWGRGWLATAELDEHATSASNGGIAMENARREKEALKQLEWRTKLERDVPSREEMLQRLANRKNKQLANARSEL